MASNDNIDKDLQGILDKLEFGEFGDSNCPDESNNESPELPQLPELPELPPLPPLPALPLKPKGGKKTKAPQNIPQVQSPPQPDPQPTQQTAPPVIQPPITNDPADDANHVQLTKLTGKYHAVFDELLDNMRADRTSLDNYINIYTINVQGDTPKQSFIEGLPTLLGIKAKISADSMKLLDTAAKMVSASKNLSADKGVSAPRDELDRLMGSDFDPDAP